MCTSAPAGAKPISSSISCATTMRTRSIWWATSSMAGGSSDHGIGPRPTTMLSRRCCAKSAKARVIYVPGNHDEWLRDYTLLQFGGVEVADEVVHVTADGRRLLVIHGDVFDAVVKHARWLAMLGDGAYTAAIWLNRYFNKVRRRLGYQYWSLSAYLKQRVKNAMQYIAYFADAVVDEALRRGLDGVVCGHIHHAEMREIRGVLYCNDGDWVESCTALVEHFDGRLELVNWIDRWALDPLSGRVPTEVEVEEDAEVPALLRTS